MINVEAIRPAAEPALAAVSPPLRITSVRFRQLKSHKAGYGHDAFEAEAAVAAGEDADLVLATLKVWVERQLGIIRDIDYNAEILERVAEKVESYRRERDRLRKEISDLREDVSAARRAAR